MSEGAGLIEEAELPSAPGDSADVGAEGGTPAIVWSTRDRCRAMVGLGFAVRWLDSQDSLLFGIGGHCRVRCEEVGTLSLPIAFAFDLDLVGVVGQTG